MSAFAVSGPDVDAKYGRVASAGHGLSVATGYASRASRAGLEATYYVRDEAGDLVGRAASDGSGSVEVWGEQAIRAYKARRVPVPSFGDRAAGDGKRRPSSAGRPPGATLEGEPANPGSASEASAPTVPTTKEDSMAEQSAAKKPAARKPSAKKAATAKAAAPVTTEQTGESLVGVLMTAVRETIPGDVEAAENKSGTYTRLRVAGKTFAYIFPPRKTGVAVKIPKQLLAVEKDLPRGHGFHRVGWGLSRTITKPDEVASVASAFAVAAAATKPEGGEG